MLDTIAKVGIIMLSLASLLGLVLAITYARFKVITDPRTDKIRDNLPGADCGACGCTGCANYAEAIVKKGADINLCSPGGEEAANEIAKIMGVEAEKKDRKVAVLMCSAKNVRNLVDYNGPKNCVSANLVQGGHKGCEYGCLGFGDCADVCKFGAITMDENGLPHVDQSKCTACGKCAEICPKGLYQILPEKKRVHVRCKNLDKGKLAKTKCDNPCIACKKCEKVCKFDAIHVIDNLAVIDYEKCKVCGKCVLVCPSLIIRNYRKGQTAEVAKKLQEEAKAKEEAKKEKEKSKIVSEAKDEKDK